jgi:hypothetical protein
VVSDFGPASRARSYRQHAHDCLSIAVRTDDAGVRVEMLKLAFSWTRMAKQTEKLEPDMAGVADVIQGVRVLIVTPEVKH